MAAIATLTMNPALDLTTVTDRVRHTHKVRCGPPRYDPGGGGINVARVVKSLGGDPVAIYPAGGAIGEMLRHSLDRTGLAQHVISVADATRESFTVDEASTGKQYRFVLPGPTLTEQEQRACLAAIAGLSPAPQYLVVSGGFPPGSDIAGLSAELAGIARKLGARLVLDTSQAMREAAPGAYLMKPSLSELSNMMGRPISNRADEIDAARKLVSEGRAEVVIVSLGAGGALLVTEADAEHFTALSVPIRSAVGAGDSMVGATVFALQQGWSLHDAVRYGMAAGAATLMTPGTELCYRHDVEALFEQIKSSHVRVHHH